MSNTSEFDIHTGYVMLDFFTVSCLPCQMLEPVLENLSIQWTQIEFIRIDCDIEKSIARQYEVMSVPTLILLHDGKLLKRFDGFAPEGMIDRILRKLVK